LKNPSVGLLSALIYLPVSLLAAGLFFVATVIGNHSWVAQIGGAVWVLILSLIITMPLVTSSVKKRSSRSAG
jgi:hypothetical protein